MHGERPGGRAARGRAARGRAGPFFSRMGVRQPRETALRKQFGIACLTRQGRLHRRCGASAAHAARIASAIASLEPSDDGAATEPRGSAPHPAFTKKHICTLWEPRPPIGWRLGFQQGRAFYRFADRFDERDFYHFSPKLALAFTFFLPCLKFCSGRAPRAPCANCTPMARPPPPSWPHMHSPPIPPPCPPPPCHRSH